LQNYRRKKRSQEHAAADHEHSGGAGSVPLDHPLVPDAAAAVVTTAEGVAELVSHMEDHPVVAFDTEFIGEESFYPKLCLIQIATADRVVLIDPAPFVSNGEPIAQLFRAVAARGRTVLMHAGETDLGILRRGAGADPDTVIDTQIAAALCWMPWPSSLGTVLESLTGYRLGKAHTFTNWDARPLTPAQLRYAADDVRYLRLMWHLLSERLNPLGRMEWALAESREQLRAADFAPEGQLRRLLRNEPLRAGQRAVARELVALRHELARANDLPTRTVLPDAAVVELAKRKPADRATLGNLSGIPRRIMQMHSDAILDAVARAKNATPEPDNTSFALDDPRVRAECDALWTAVQVRANSIGLAPNLVATRSSFTRWFGSMVDARKAGRALSPCEGSDPLFAADDWRMHALGNWLHAFLQGKERLELVWGEQGVVAPGFERPR
jgi:ribonuclease D